jgi:hypothetical protein
MTAKKVDGQIPAKSLTLAFFDATGERSSVTKPE